MAQEKSLADRLLAFMRARDEATKKIDSLSHDGSTWPELGMLLEQQERAVRDALDLATMTAYRLGRVAETVSPPESHKG